MTMMLSRLHVSCEIFCLALFSVATLEEVLIEESSAVESLHAPRGGSVELPCDVTPALADDSMALVIWYKQGHDAPIYSFDSREGVTSHWSDPSTLGARATFRSSTEPAVLVINNLRAEDSGQYRCRVDFIKSPTKNTRLNLTVLIPPERLVILDRDGAELNGGVLGPYDEGDDVSVTCIAVGGRPLARVSWWGDHALLANSEARATVSITLRRNHYGTNLTCQAVTDPTIPPLSTTLTIDMNLRLLRVQLLGGQRPLVAGQSTELVCRAVGARPKPNISWWKAGVRLKTARETVSPDGNVTSSVLTFVPSIDDAGRVLSCRAVQPTAPHSTGEDGWRLEIQHLPVVKLELGANLKADAIVEGSDVYLDCTVNANPGHTLVYFTHNGMVVKPGPGVLLANQSLVLQHVSRRAAGAYLCAARSSLGEGASDILVLDVKYSPTCKSPRLVVRAARGELVDVACELDANPREPMSYQWWFNGTTHDRHELTVPTTSHTTGSFSYLVSSSRSYGWVQCAGTNSVGQQTTPCVFTILPAGFLTMFSFTGERAMVSCTLDGARVHLEMWKTHFKASQEVRHNPDFALKRPRPYPLDHQKPSPVRECSVMNVTSDSLRVACASGHDGGVKQTFLLQVLEIGSDRLLRNLSSAEPTFTVWGLDSAAVMITVRAYNEKGASEPATLTVSLPNTFQEHTASVPVTVELSTVLMLVVGAVVVTAAGAALAASVMCCRHCNRQDNKDKEDRKQDVTSDKPLTGGESDSVDSLDKNPDIIPVENKTGDSHVISSKPLLFERRSSEWYEQHRRGGPHRRLYQPEIMTRNTPYPGLDECGIPHDPEYEEWLRYNNSLPLNTTGLLPMARLFPPPPATVTPNYQPTLELHTDIESVSTLSRRPSVSRAT